MLPDQTLGEPFVAQSKDISKRGMALILPCPPPQDHLVLSLQASAQDPVVKVPAQIRHSQLLNDGRYEVGVKFIRK